MLRPYAPTGAKSSGNDDDDDVLGRDTYMV